MLKTTIQFTIDWIEPITEEDLHALEEALRFQIICFTGDIKRAFPEASIGGVEFIHH